MNCVERNNGGSRWFRFRLVASVLFIVVCGSGSDDDDDNNGDPGNVGEARDGNETFWTAILLFLFLVVVCLE